jgi:hypothetical protein
MSILSSLMPLIEKYDNFLALFSNPAYNELLETEIHSTLTQLIPALDSPTLSAAFREHTHKVIEPIPSTFQSDMQQLLEKARELFANIVFLVAGQQM